MAQVHGGRLVAQGLKRHGVDTVFTLCGSHVQAIYDGCIDEHIRVVDTRHEQTAGFAADAYSRLFGDPGVAIVGAGAGVANCAAAMANALRAGIPLVCLGGAAPQALSHRGAFKCIDSVSLMASVTKWAVMVPETSRIKEYIDSAFRIAQGGCPGPVYLELPLDHLMTLAEDTPPATRPAEPARPAASPDALRNVSKLLSEAKRPIFVVGSQLRWSPNLQAVEKLANQIGAPFFLNGLAKGALPPSHPCLLARCRKLAIAEADVVILVGTPLDFRLNYGSDESWDASTKLVQIDLDSEVLGQNRALAQAVQADSGLFLEQLSEYCDFSAPPEWLQHLREQEPESSNSKPGGECSPLALAVYRELSQRLGPEDILIADGGQFVTDAMRHMPIVSKQLWLAPGPFGAMGIGPGFAMAASLFRPKARAVIVSGDGAFGLSTAEYEALARQGFRVITVVGNNAGRGQVRRGQAQLYGTERAIASGLSHCRYDQAVEALGGKGHWVESIEQLPSALDSAFAATLPTCVNVALTP